MTVSLSSCSSTSFFSTDNNVQTEFQRSPSETSLRALIDCSHTAEELSAIITHIGEKKLFQCNDCSEALALIEPWVQSRDALKQAVRMLSLPQAALWFGIRTDDRTFIQEALTQGADVNAPLYPVMTALQLACDLDNPELAEMLLDLGACVQVVCGTHQHKTPWMSALRSPAFAGTAVLARIERLDNGFTPEFCARKRLAHQYSVTAKEAKSLFVKNSFHYEGARIGLVDTLDLNDEFLRTLQRELRGNAGPFLEKIRPISEQLNRGTTRAQLCIAIDIMLSTLRQCYDCERSGKHADPNEMQKQALKRLAQGRPVVCFGITRVPQRWLTGASNSHAWGLVITKDPGTENYRVQRCNRGYGSASDSGIVETKMTHAEVVLLVEKFYRAADWKKDVFGTEVIKEIETLFSKDPKTCIRQKYQPIGNCCYYSAQSIKLALLLALLPPCIQGGERIALAKAIKNEMTAFTKDKELARYLETPSHTLDFRLLAALLLRKKKLSLRCNKLLSSSNLKAQILESAFLNELWIRLIRKPEFPKIDLEPEGIRDFIRQEENTALIQKIKELTITHESLRLTQEITQLSALTNLFIIGCRLKSLPELSLPNLVTLDLSSNKLTALPRLELPSIKHLSLCSNRLTSLPADFTPQTLMTFNIASNAFDKLPDFSRFRSLVHLDINGNPIRSALDIDESFLSSFPSVKLELIHTILKQLVKCALEPIQIAEEELDALLALFKTIPSAKDRVNWLGNLTGIPLEIRDAFFRTIDIDESSMISLNDAEKRKFIESLFPLQYPYPLEDQTLKKLALIFQKIRSDHIKEQLFSHILFAGSTSAAHHFYESVPDINKQEFPYINYCKRVDSQLPEGDT